MRKLSVDLLMETSRQKSQYQYIFITPHDIFIEEADKDRCKIMKLQPPRASAAAAAAALTAN
jgi:hypothetical protein